MARKTERGFDPLQTYIHLPDGPVASTHAGGPAFWATIGERTDLQDGRLVTTVRMDVDWPNWEMHPAGDEIVCLLSGAMDLVLQEAAGERTVSLRGRAACIVPQGVWHRGIVLQPGDALFITRGAGTQHRPV